MSDHLKGLLFALTGVLVLSPDTLLIRLADIEQWSLLVYRGLLMALGMALISKHLDPAPLLTQYRNVGRLGILAAFFFCHQHDCLCERGDLYHHRAYPGDRSDGTAIFSPV